MFSTLEIKEGHKRRRIFFLFLVFIVCAGVFVPFFVDAQSPSVDLQKGSAAGTSEVLSNTTGGLLGGAADYFFGNIFRGAAFVFQWFAGFVLAAGNWVLDLSIEYSLQTQNLKLSGVVEGWTIIRDVANITFIFILLYVAIATILQFGGFNTKRILATLIVMALLINFSFFLTGVVIDAGNIFAIALYNDLTEGGTIGDQLQKALKLENIFSDNSFGGLQNWKVGVAYTFMGILYLTAGFVFLFGGILFVLRTIKLMFALILSPIVFAAAILPKTKHYFDEWLDTLVHQSFLAPIFLLLIAVVLKILEAGDQIKGQIAAVSGSSIGDIDYTSTITNIDNLGPSGFSVFLFFVLVIGLMLGALTLTVKFAGAMGALAVKYAGMVTGRGMGGLGVLGRGVFGRGGQAFYESEKFKKMEREGGVKGKIVGALRTGSSYAAKSNFDLRGTGVAGLAGGAVGTNFGRATNRGGFAAIQKQQIEKKVERVENLLSGTGKTTVEENSQLQEYHAQVTELERQLKVSRDNDEKANIQGELRDVEQKIQTVREQAKQRGAQAREALATRIENEGVGIKIPFMGTVKPSVSFLDIKPSLMSGAARHEAAQKIRRGKTEYEKFFQKLKEDARKDDDLKNLFESEKTPPEKPSA